MAELWGRRKKNSVPQKHLVDVTKMRREEMSTTELPNSSEAPEEISCTPLIEAFDPSIPSSSTSAPRIHTMNSPPPAKQKKLNKLDDMANIFNKLQDRMFEKLQKMQDQHEKADRRFLNLLFNKIDELKPSSATLNENGLLRPKYVSKKDQLYSQPGPSTSKIKIPVFSNSQLPAQPSIPPRRYIVIHPSSNTSSPDLVNDSRVQQELSDSDDLIEEELEYDFNSYQ